MQRLAKSGVCVIALSQLSRGGEGMAALRGSGQIEQDADVVMLLDYPSEKDVESDEEAADLEAGRLRVIEIVKNKGGRRGLSRSGSAVRSSGSSPSGKDFTSPNYA